jgi:hypothetical protein
VRLYRSRIVQREEGKVFEMAAQDTNPPRLWHAIGAEEALRQLGSDAARGLEAGQIAQRFASYGPNRLPEGA